MCVVRQVFFYIIRQTKEGSDFMSRYLTERERVRIEYMLKDGQTPKQIASALGKHYTTIYKEIKKGTVELMNSDLTYRKEYCADAAQRITVERGKNKGRDLKIGHDYELAAYIEHLIGKRHYSPYAAVCDIRKSGRFCICICKTTLYSYIDMGLFLNISNKDLYSKRRKKKKKDGSPRVSYKHVRAKSIEERPKAVDDRKEYGHWEMDTVYPGKGEDKSKQCLLVLTERMTRQEYIFRMPDRTLASTVSVLDRLERVIGFDVFKERFKTITADNGSEFGDATMIERSCTCSGRDRTAVYFCHPNASYERGSNENANKLVRHWIPKGADIGKYSDAQIADMQDWMNSLPRRLFDGLSVNEYMEKYGIG